MKSRILSGVSGVAVIVCLSLGGAAFAQAPDLLPTSASADCDPDLPGVQADCTTNRVVITGSNIAGSSESAALPVEVFTQEDNLNQGNQTALELIKSLTASGETLGESNLFLVGSQGYGSSNVNLRGLGGGRTLTIFNGRRFSQNTNMIPQAALARTEILKLRADVDRLQVKLKVVETEDLETLRLVVDALAKYLEGP